MERYLKFDTLCGFAVFTKRCFQDKLNISEEKTVILWYGRTQIKIRYGRIKITFNDRAGHYDGRYFFGHNSPAE